MPLAAFEPGKEMAIANFSLAIFCLFTVALPLILITRGDKTEANRNFIAATLNPWSQVVNETVLTPVVVSEMISTINNDTNSENFVGKSSVHTPESDHIISIEVKECDGLNESIDQFITTDDELRAA